MKHLTPYRRVWYAWLDASSTWWEQRMGMGMLQITVAAEESGPVVRLSGECDISVTGQLSDALNAQIAGGQRHLTVDLSGLRFADSACIRVLVKAHLALTQRGGTLELAFPRPAVARVLRLLGVDQRLPVRMQASGGDATDASLRMVTGAVRQ